jgi:dihydrolipoamide dehydrogenase
MEFKAASEDLARICNPHPTLNEAIKEASLATYFKPIHL